MSEGKAVHPVDQLVHDVERIKQELEEQIPQDAIAQTTYETLRYNVVPVVHDFVKLWITWINHMQSVNQKQQELFGGIGSKLADLEAAVVSVSDRVDGLDSVDDYDTRITQEHAEMLSAFVRAGMHIASQSAIGQDEQTAFLLRGKEILDLIETNTIAFEEEEEEQNA